MPLLARMLAAFASGMPQKADFVQSRPENTTFGQNTCRGVLCAPVRLLAALCAPYRTPAPRRTPCRDCSRCVLCSACRVCSWSAAERRFCAIAAGKTPPAAGMLAAFASGVPQNADFVQSRPEKRPFPLERLPRRAVCSGATACCIVRPLSYTPHLAVRPAATAHAVCAGVKVCRVCNWNASEGRFCAIAAGKTPLSAGMPPRLHLECRRTPILCNRGWEDVPYGPNACRVCSWSAVEGRFRAIAAGKTPL